MEKEGDRDGKRVRRKEEGEGVAGFFSHTQTVEEAGKFFQRRLDYVTKNLETLQKTLLEKCKMREGMYLGPNQGCLSTGSCDIPTI